MDIGFLNPKNLPRGAIVTVKTKDGRELTERADYSKGEPENPLSFEELQEKIINLLKDRLGKEQVDMIIEKINNLENIDDIGDLTSLLKV